MTSEISIESDYRDMLRALVDEAYKERGLTRYRLCKQMGMDCGTLSNVLAKRRHFSTERLSAVLKMLGYELTVKRVETPVEQP